MSGMQLNKKNMETEKSPEFEHRDELPAVIVLGGGFKESGKMEFAKPLSLGLESKMRVLAAGMLYESGSVDKIIFSGGKTAGEDNLSEAQAMMDYLQKKFPEIPVEKIFLEERSLSTGENAADVKKRLEELKIQESFLLTSQSHVRRASIIFGKSGVDYQQAIAAENILKDRSEHYRAFVKRYLSSPRIKLLKFREAVLNSLFYIDSEGKMVKMVVDAKQFVQGIKR